MLFHRARPAPTPTVGRRGQCRCPTHRRNVQINQTRPTVGRPVLGFRRAASSALLASRCRCFSEPSDARDPTCTGNAGRVAVYGFHGGEDSRSLPGGSRCVLETRYGIEAVFRIGAPLLSSAHERSTIPWGGSYLPRSKPAQCCGVHSHFTGPLRAAHTPSGPFEFDTAARFFVQRLAFPRLHWGAPGPGHPDTGHASTSNRPRRIKRRSPGWGVDGSPAYGRSPPPSPSAHPHR